MTGPVDKWYTEPILPTFLHQLKLKAVHFTGKTAYQSVQIIETEPLGITLVLDGKTQSAQADEFIYHESLVHPALVAHPNPVNVLIAGGGEGATLREALAHRTVERVVMVDLDSELVEICKHYLPSWHQGAFDDPRVELLFGDARQYIQDYGALFDVIIMDITDPSEGGPSYLLFTQEFYRTALKKLAPEGILVTQAGPAGFEMAEVFTAVANTMGSVFGKIVPYRVGMLSFGSDWGFVMAGRRPSPAACDPDEVDRRLASRVASELRFYDGEAHAGLFGLPKWLRGRLAADEHVITEANPVFMV